MIWREPLRFSLVVNGVVVMGCEVVGIGLADF